MHTMPAFAHELPEMASVTSSVKISGRYSNSLDFDQYLLASSPPGFTYNVLSKSGGYDSTTKYGYEQPDSRFPAGSDWYSSSSQFHESFINGSKHEQQLRLLTNTQPLATSSKTNAESPRASRRSMSDATNNLTRTSRCDRVKKVSFADDFGLRLTEVKLFSEMPDTPSIIKMRFTSNSPNTFSTMQSSMQSPTNASSINPLLVPDFQMPISNSTALNEKVERDFISLESLYVATNRTLVGTVKVKNLAFMKKVFVRCSFDAWRSYVNIPCNYRPTTYLEEIDHSYDWFTFTLGIPAGFKAGGSADFAICFQCNNNEYWDNNWGENYRLASPDWLKKDTEDLNGSMDLKWAAYVDWKDRSMSWPYW